MIVAGLTGSIGTGKSTTAAMFAARGVPVYDADRAVHVLYAGPAVEAVGALFPDAVVDGRIDRQRLSRHVVGNAEAMAALEGVVHPLVRAVERSFLDDARTSASPLAVLDVPLLFETGRDREVDLVVVVTAPEDVQRARVLARPGMTEDKLAGILSRQLPDAHKRRRAHVVIDTSRGFAPAARAVDAVIRMAATMQGKA